MSAKRIVMRFAKFGLGATWNWYRDERMALDNKSGTDRRQVWHTYLQLAIVGKFGGWRRKSLIWERSSNQKKIGFCCWCVCHRIELIVNEELQQRIMCCLISKLEHTGAEFLLSEILFRVRVWIRRVPSHVHGNLIAASYLTMERRVALESTRSPLWSMKMCFNQMKYWMLFEAEECGKAGELLGDKMHYLKNLRKRF